MIAIDLGSNTIRFIEFDGNIWGKSFEKIVKTAEALHTTQCIGMNALERILGAIDEAQNILDFSSHTVVAYATAAMRLALNATEILREIEIKTAIHFTVIDAEKEAFLTLMAVRYRLKQLNINPESFVLVDIGGGSTELISFSNNEIESVSINMGIVTVSESADSLIALEGKIELFKNKINESLPHLSSNSPLILSSGTPTTISAYVLGMDYDHYEPEKVNGFHLKLGECYRVYDELLAMDSAHRCTYVGVGRENLIIAGILMVTAIYDAAQWEEAIIIDDGLREGIALEYFIRS
ncbi:phosphatase [Sulfuricurvum sp.]|uniref:Ppx/GppA phosphatase family protein n=1 Tax=Sulfuricurvum sp. TaxID=2025608 RepID=UPI002627784A|nr:phosphatase [Sulfuricurvum sp.]MDD2780512.1 phosphatase [Sulfuricurvum sp.]